MTNDTSAGLQAPPPLALRANFSWILVGTAGYAVAQWAVLISLARLGTAEMVGQFALALAVVTPITLLCKLSLRAVIATDAADDFPFGVYLGLRVATTVVSLALIAAVALAAGYRLEVALLIVLLGVAKGFEGISELAYGLLQKHERMSHIGVSLLARGAISLVVATVALWSTGSVLGVAAGMAAGWLVWLVAYDLRKAGAYASMRPTFATQQLWGLTRLAFPLGLVALLLSLSGNIPRYFIERFHGEAELGVFAALAYLMVVGTTATGALGLSAGPRLARYFAAARPAAFVSLLRRLVLVALGLGVAAIAGAAVLGRQIIDVVYGPLYAQEHALLMWLMAAAMLGYVASIFGYAITAQRQFAPQVRLFGGVVIVQTAACALLVPGGGSIGAAHALLIATAVQLIGTAHICRRALRESVSSLVPER
jgi:O-antigen/teichoic acid export membrane protein